MNIGEIKAQADKKILESIQLALGVYELEKDEDKKTIGILTAKVQGLSNAIDYLYGVIETLI